jgi:elongation factor Ts
LNYTPNDSSAKIIKSEHLVGAKEMAEITAAKVKSFRERTGLPLMECKSALAEAGGDEEKAVQILRERGEKLGDKRASRETAFGRFGLYYGPEKSKGAIVELKCESAPVTQNEEFIQLSEDLAEALANSAESLDTPEELLALESPSKSGTTLKEQMAELFNRIREKFEVGRMAKLDGTCGGYFHNSGTVAGVLIAIEGGSETAAKDVAMHIAAMRPQALRKEDLDPAEVQKEREILKAAALKEGKPENIVDKMVEGRLRQFFAERSLLEQPFVKDDKQTVSQYAKDNGMEIKGFVHYVLGQ